MASEIYYKVDEEFEFEGNKYKCVEQNLEVNFKDKACTGCFSATQYNLCLYVKCQKHKRIDKKDVIFIRVEGENNV